MLNINTHIFFYFSIADRSAMDDIVKRTSSGGAIMKFIIYKFGKKGKYASYKDVPDYVEWVPIGFLNTRYILWLYVFTKLLPIWCFGGISILSKLSIIFERMGGIKMKFQD